MYLRTKTSATILRQIASTGLDAKKLRHKLPLNKGRLRAAKKFDEDLFSFEMKEKPKCAISS